LTDIHGRAKDLAEWVHLTVDQLVELLATLEVQPPAVREGFLRRFVEAWLKEQKEDYQVGEHGD